MLLAMGADVYLKPKEDDKPLDCQLQPNKMIGKVEPTPDAYQKAVRYARTDILEIYGYRPPRTESTTKH